ncbi:MAG: alanine racemase [Cocleimonas sp.]
MNRSATITIHPKALQHNLNQAKKSAPNSKVTAVIKANAYGHGAVATAGILYPDTDGFSVSCIQEAVELRQAHIDLPITVLQGHQSSDDLRIAMHYGLRLTVHDERQLSLLDLFSHTHRFDLNIKVDTGMHRLGFHPDKTSSIYKKLKEHALVNPKNLMLMTHLSCADELDNDTTKKQLTVFDKACSGINTPRTIANSAGILGWKTSHADWIRPGIMLYGSSPFSAINRKEYDLQTTMTLNAPVISVHQLKKGDSIGYGATWQCPNDMNVAVIACGYADGYPRHASSGTPIWLNGEKAPLLGRVSMDMIVIDVNHIKEQAVQVGDIAELWGNHINIDEVAKNAETISYELLCNAGNNCQHSSG